MMTEINPSDNYRRDNIKLLTKFSIFHHNKVFKQMVRQDVLGFLDSHRKTEASDPLHKWIGTYNLFRIYLLRFFKWLYYHDIESDKTSLKRYLQMEQNLEFQRKNINI